MKKTLTKVGLVAGALMIAGSAFAHFSDEAKEAIEQNDFEAFQAAVEGTRGENITEERFDQIVVKHETKEDRREAIESGGYDAFVALVPEGREAPSEEVFDLLGDLREAKEDGNEEDVADIKAELQELGFEKPNKKRDGNGRRGSGPKGS